MLLFTPEQGDYIKNRHMHETQKTLRDDDEGLLISLEVQLNRELEDEILPYIPDVEVIEPLILRRNILDRLERGLKRFKRNKNKKPE